MSVLADEANRQQNTIIKTGIGSQLIFQMDDITFKSHFRLTRDQFEVFSSKLSELGNNSRQAHTRLPMKIKAAIFLWYMANQNSFREIGNNFGVARSTAHDTIE